MLKKLFNNKDLENRIYGLDLMRAIAIILVVLGHVRWMTEKFPKPIRVALHGSGILGVELFFVLSGFLIGGILLKTFDAKRGKPDAASIRTFWIRRWFRTLPNYYFILFIMIAMYWNELPDNIYRYFFFTQNFLNTPHYFFEDSWSLCIEEISYLVSPLIIASLAYLLPKFLGKIFLLGALILIAFVTILKAYYISTNLTGNYTWNNDVREVALLRLDAIYFGFVVVYFKSRFADLWNKSTILFWPGLIATVGLMAIQKNITGPEAGLMWNVFFNPLLSLSIAMMIPKLYFLKAPSSSFMVTSVTTVSLISYSMYLLNDGIISWTIRRFTSDGINWTAPQFAFAYVAYWIGCISLSWLLYRFFEKPFMDLRNRFS